MRGTPSRYLCCGDTLHTVVGTLHSPRLCSLHNSLHNDSPGKAQVPVPRSLPITAPDYSPSVPLPLQRRSIIGLGPYGTPTLSRFCASGLPSLRNDWPGGAVIPPAARSICLRSGPPCILVPGTSPRWLPKLQACCQWLLSHSLAALPRRTRAAPRRGPTTVMGVGSADGQATGEAVDGQYDDGCRW